jgi:hypothetical protein
MALLYVSLEKEKHDAGIQKRWKVKPKLHMFLELCGHVCLQSERGNPRNFWTYADESHGGSMKRSFLSGSYVGVDFGIRVNLATATQEDINKAFDRHGDETRSENQRACEDFCQELEIGDYVLLKIGRSVIAAYGRIEGDYEFKANAVSYPHQRKVTWLSTRELQVPRETGMLPIKTLTAAKQSNPVIQHILQKYQSPERNFMKSVWLALPPEPTTDFPGNLLSFDWDEPSPTENSGQHKLKMRPRFKS